MLVEIHDLSLAWHEYRLPCNTGVRKKPSRGQQQSQLCSLAKGRYAPAGLSLKNIGCMQYCFLFAHTFWCMPCRLVLYPNSAQLGSNEAEEIYPEKLFKEALAMGNAKVAIQLEQMYMYDIS